MRRHAFICLLVLSLTSCGFHLRDMLDMPPWLKTISLLVPNQSRELEHQLKEQLKAYCIRIQDDPANAPYWLVIENEDMQQNITSVSSSTNPRQYQLIYTINFKLQRAKAEDIIPSTKIAVTRQLTVNSDRILGSNDEEAKLIREMRRDAAIKILERIGKVCVNPN